MLFRFVLFLFFFSIDVCLGFFTREEVLGVGNKIMCVLPTTYAPVSSLDSSASSWFPVVCQSRMFPNQDGLCLLMQSHSCSAVQSVYSTILSLMHQWVAQSKYTRKAEESSLVLPPFLFLRSRMLFATALLKTWVYRTPIMFPKQDLWWQFCAARW